MSYTPDPARRIFVSYIDKSREYYAAHGYEQPYRWASHDESPFAPPGKPLSECRVGLVTTASLSEAGGETYGAPADPPPERLHTMQRFWDKDATHTDDLDSFFPVHRLLEYAAEGRIGSTSPRFYGVPTVYSQRGTREDDAPQVLGMMREDGVDAAVLVPL